MNLFRTNTLSQLMLAFMLLLAFSCKSAKPEPDITGQYRMGNGGDPQGGATLFVLPDHRFVVIFFGGAAMGTWEIKDSTAFFKPQTLPSGFNVYGRHNNKLGDSIRVFFDGFATVGGAAIGFDASTKNVKQVFNDSPNCTQFPYVGKFAQKPAKIVLAARPVDQGGSIAAGAAWHIFTFNNDDHYNDFVAAYKPEQREERPQDFNGKIKNGKLQLDDRASAREPLPKDGEMKGIYQLLSMPLNPDDVFYNPYFKEAQPGPEKDTLNYRFNKQKDAYINFPNYVEGEENKSEQESDFNNMDVIYRYHKLSSSNSNGKVNLEAKPIFTAKCDTQ
jgi:hypothetical protein